jgi:regulator of protease activity HflC (stomatin/prohibitin superfamily)
MAAERDRRKQVLDTRALVNVAEGHKQRTILESEGCKYWCFLQLQLVFTMPFVALQSRINEAAGEKRKLILESEGMLEAAKNQGEALAGQVDILAKSLAAPNTIPTLDDRVKALDAILELRRLEQLKAIASGSGNSTYFFGDSRGIGRDAYDIENVERWKRSLPDSQRIIDSSQTPISPNPGAQRSAPVHSL